MRLKLKQGRPHLLLDMRIVGEDGRELPWDGQAFGIRRVQRRDRLLPRRLQTGVGVRKRLVSRRLGSRVRLCGGGQLGRGVGGLGGGDGGSDCVRLARQYSALRFIAPTAPCIGRALRRCAAPPR